MVCCSPCGVAAARVNRTGVSGNITARGLTVAVSSIRSARPFKYGLREFARIHTSVANSLFREGQLIGNISGVFIAQVRFTSSREFYYVFRASRRRMASSSYGVVVSEETVCQPSSSSSSSSPNNPDPVSRMDDQESPGTWTKKTGSPSVRRCPANRLHRTKTSRQQRR